MTILKHSALISFFLLAILTSSTSAKSCPRLPKPVILSLFKNFVQVASNCNQSEAETQAYLDAHAKSVQVYTPKERLVGDAALQFLRNACEALRISPTPIDFKVGSAKVVGNQVAFRARVDAQNLKPFEYSASLFFCGDEIVTYVATADDSDFVFE